jgi:hypothetical protein
LQKTANQENDLKGGINLILKFDMEKKPPVNPRAVS